MIKQPTVLIAQPIAERNVLENKSVLAGGSTIILGLNELSHPVAAHELQTLPITLPEYTASTAEHGQQLDAVTTKLAELVQLSFTQIRKYLKPFTQRLGSELMGAVDYDTSTAKQIFEHLDVKYRELDLAFFDSMYYPTEITNTMVDYSSVPLSQLRFPGKLPEINYEAIANLINVDNKDVNAVLEDFCPGQAFELFVKNLGWTEYFTEYNGNVDFRSLKDTCPCKVFSLFILFNYLNATDTIIDGVTGVTEQEYQTWVKFVLGCLTQALISIRQNYRMAAAHAFPQLKGEVRVSTGGSVKYLTGKVVIGVTKDTIAKFQDAPSETTISEAIIGRFAIELNLVERPAGMTPGNIIDGKGVFGEAYNAYASIIGSNNKSKIHDRVTSAVNAALDGFQKQHPEFSETISRFEAAAEYCRLSSHLKPAVWDFVNAYIAACIDNEVDPQLFIQGSDLVIQLGEALGLVVAAKILKESTVSNAGALDEVQQRENLTKAVAKILTQFVINFK